MHQSTFRSPQQHAFRILVLDDQPSECARIKEAFGNIPEVNYQLSFIDKAEQLETMSLYSYDLCIVDENLDHHRASELIKQHHLGDKLPTVLYGQTSLQELNEDAENEVHDVLHPSALSPDLVEHVIQHAYTQFHFEKELAALAFTDELTGLASRRMFEYQLDLSMKRVDRTQKPLSMTIFQLENYRDVNDEFGFVIGDAVLRYLSSILSDHVRPYDCVARLGVDRFAIIFEEANKSQAYRAVADIEQEFAAGCFVNGCVVPMSLTVGLSEFEQGLSVPMLVREAEVDLQVQQENAYNFKQNKLMSTAFDESETIDEISSLSKKQLH